MGLRSRGRCSIDTIRDRNNPHISLRDTGPFRPLYPVGVEDPGPVFNLRWSRLRRPVRRGRDGLLGPPGPKVSGRYYIKPNLKGVRHNEDKRPTIY